MSHCKRQDIIFVHDDTEMGCTTHPLRVQSNCRKQVWPGGAISHSQSHFSERHKFAPGIRAKITNSEASSGRCVAPETWGSSRMVHTPPPLPLIFRGCQMAQDVARDVPGRRR